MKKIIAYLLCCSITFSCFGQVEEDQKKKNEEIATLSGLPSKRGRTKKGSASSSGIHTSMALSMVAAGLTIAGAAVAISWYTNHSD